MVSELEVPALVPSNASPIRHGLSSAGSSGASSPTSQVATPCSDSRSPFRPHFVAFAWPYRAELALRSQARASSPAWVLGFVHPVLVRDFARRRSVLLGPWGALLHACPALRPRRRGRSLANARHPLLPSAFWTASASANAAHAAPSRGLRAPCVRFTVATAYKASDAAQHSVPTAG